MTCPSPQITTKNQKTYRQCSQVQCVTTANMMFWLCSVICECKCKHQCWRMLYIPWFHTQLLQLFNKVWNNIKKLILWNSFTNTNIYKTTVQTHSGQYKSLNKQFTAKVSVYSVVKNIYTQGHTFSNGYHTNFGNKGHFTVSFFLFTEKKELKVWVIQQVAKQPKIVIYGQEFNCADI